MHSFDFVVIGGGMVGLSAALGCAQLGYQVAVVDAGPPPQVSDTISNRVSAINAASEHWLTELNAWAGIRQQRATPFKWMQVWQANYGGEVILDGNELGVPALGHIVENQVICHALYEQASDSPNIQLFYSASARQMNLGEREAWLTLDDGTMLGAQQIVGADGGHSWCRQQADMPITFRDYGHHALVATVRTEREHEHCARQAFTEQGPLAFLPLNEPSLCSMVWSVPPEVATEYETLEPQAFERKLTAAFDSQLGMCQLKDKVNRIPLTMRYARQWLKPRIALMGDAAHTIHPLAGQGVNLGFADAKAFCEQLAQLQEQGVTDLGELQHWRPYERSRKAAAVEMIAAMEAIKLAFSPQPAPLKQLIGLGMNLVNQTRPAKSLLMKRAMGI